MSSIDERVVELQFNNGQFEAGVKESMGTLEKLKKSLNLEASANSLSGLEKAGKRFDLSNVSKNIQTVADRCSALGVIGDQVLRTLTSKALTFSKNILTAIPKQIVAGGKKRAMNIEQAKFQMEGLLGPDEFAKQWETINKNINEAVAGTAYGYDEAAKVAAQLKASNIDFGDDMQKILTGISGVAAMTNGTYEDIGHIFTTIAGQGKVMTQQLNQFAGRGLNVAAELAKHYKVDEATLRNMVTKGKVDFKTFALAMNEAFGEQAQKANKTFSGAVSNFNASLSRMGAQFAQPAFEAIRQFLAGDIDNNGWGGLIAVLKDVEKLLYPISERFTELAEASSAYANKVLGTFHDALQPIVETNAALHKQWEAAREAKKALEKKTETVATEEKANKKVTKQQDKILVGEKNVQKAWNKSAKVATMHDAKLGSLEKSYKNLSQMEKLAGVSSEFLSSAWDKLPGPAKAIAESIGERTKGFLKLLNLEKEEAKTAEESEKTYQGIEELAKDVILGKYGSGEDRKKALEELGVSYGVIQNKVNELLGCEKRYEVTEEDLAKTAAYFGATVDENGQIAAETGSNFDKLTRILAGLGAAIRIVKDFSSALWNEVLVPFGQWAGPIILNGIVTILAMIGDAFVNLSNSIPDGFFDEKFKAFADFFRNVGSAFTEFTGKVKELESVKKLIESFKNLGAAISGFFSTGFEKISGIFSNIGESAEEGLDFSSFLPTIDSLSEIITKVVDAITAGLGAVWPILEDFGLSLSNLFKTIKESETTQKLIESFGNLRDSIGNFLSLGFEKITGFFTNLGKTGEEGGHKLDWLTGIIEGISNALTWFSDKVGGVFDKITAFVQAKFTSENFEKFKTSIETFINKVKESEHVQAFMKTISDLAKAVKDLFDNGFEKISGEVEKINTEGEKGEGNFDWLLTILNGAAWILTKITGLATTVISKIGPTLESIGTSLTQFFSKEDNAKRIEALSTSFTNLSNAAGALFDLGLDKLAAQFSKIGESGDGEKTEGWSSIFTGIADSITLVIDSITKLFTIIQQNGGNVKESIKQWFNEGGLLETGKTAGKTLVEGLVDGIGTLLFGNDVFASEDGDMLAGVAAVIEKQEPSLKEKVNIVLKRIGAAIKEAIKSFIFGDEVFAAESEGGAGGEAIAANVGSVVDSAVPTIKDLILQKLKDFGSWLTSAISNLDFNTFLKGLRIGALSFVGIKIGRFFGSITKTVKLFNSFFKGKGKGLEEGATGIVGSIKGLIYGIKESFTGNAAILTESLASVPNKLNEIIGGIGDIMKSQARNYNASAALKIAIIIGIFVGIIYLLSKYADPEKLGAIVGVITPLAIAIAAVIGAIALLKDKLNMAKAIEGGNAQGEALKNISEGVNSFLDGMKKALAKALTLVGLGVLFMGIGVALLAFAFAVKILSDIPLNDALSRAAILVSFIVILGLAAALMSKYAENFKAGMGIGLLAMAAAVLVLVKAMEALGTMDENTMMRGVLALTGVLGLLVTVGAVVSKFIDAKKILAFAGACLILGAALTFLLVPLLLYAVLPIELIMNGLSKMALALGLIIVAAHGAQMASAGLASLGATCLAVAGAVLLFGVGLVTVALGLQVFVEALIGIGPVFAENIGSFMLGLAALSVVMLTLIALGALATLVAPGLIALSLVMVAFAAALYLIAAAMDKSPKMQEFIEGAFAGVTEQLTNIFSGIKDKFEGIKSFIENFVVNVPVIGDLYKLLFPETETKSFVDKLASKYTLTDEQKASLVEKINTSLTLSGEELKVSVTSLMAEIDSYDLPPGKAEELKAEVLEKLRKEARERTNVTFSNITTTLKKAKASTGQKEKLLNSIRDLVSDNNLTEEEKTVKLAQINAQISTWQATGELTVADATLLRTQIQALIDQKADQLYVTMAEVEVLINGFTTAETLTEDQATELNNKINALLGVTDGKTLRHELNELQMWCTAVGLDAATTQLVIDAANGVVDLYTKTIGERMAERNQLIEQALEEGTSGIGTKGFTIDAGSQLMTNLMYQNIDGDIAAFADHIRELIQDTRQISPLELISSILPPEGTTQEEWKKYLLNTLFDAETIEEASEKNFNMEGFIKLFEGSDLFYNSALLSGENVDAGLGDGVEKGTAAENAMQAKAELMEKKINDYFGIASPSKLFMQKGLYIIKGLAEGIKKNTVLAEGALRVLAVKCLNALVSRIKDFYNPGRNMAAQLASGLKSGGSQVLASARVLGNNAIDGIKDKLGTGSGEGTKGYELGKNFGEGFVNGIKSKIQDVYDASYEMGKKAGEGGAHGEQAQSPSRVAIRLGNYFGEGFVIGINEFGTKVYSAAHDMATGAVEALSNPLSVVQDILSGELEVDPTIRPVMDLSEIQNGVGLINGMSPTMSVGIGSISASMNSRKTNPNEEVISAIHLLGDKLNQPSNIYNVNGITYDDGSNISDAVRGLIRAARVERRR